MIKQYERSNMTKTKTLDTNPIAIIERNINDCRLIVAKLGVTESDEISHLLMKSFDEISVIYDTIGSDDQVVAINQINKLIDFSIACMGGDEDDVLSDTMFDIDGKFANFPNSQLEKDWIFSVTGDINVRDGAL